MCIIYSLKKLKMNQKIQYQVSQFYIIYFLDGNTPNKEKDKSLPSEPPLYPFPIPKLTSPFNGSPHRYALNSPQSSQSFPQNAFQEPNSQLPSFDGRIPDKSFYGNNGQNSQFLARSAPVPSYGGGNSRGYGLGQPLQSGPYSPQQQYQSQQQQQFGQQQYGQQYPSFQRNALSGSPGSFNPYG